MARTIFFACGDSYPADRPAEELLRGLLEGPDSDFVTHGDLFNSKTGTGGPGQIDLKAKVLEQAIRDCGPGREIFLIGRSAGARTATIAAGKCPVTAIVSIFYPFRDLQRQLEPKRFAHLRTLTVPTLMLQGAYDPYGGLEVTEFYQLSESIRLKFIEGHHRLKIAAEEGAFIPPMIVDFIKGGWRETGRDLENFDEDFYLTTHPDVAEAIAAGRFISGEDHFRKQGRKECRVYRLRYDGQV